MATSAAIKRVAPPRHLTAGTLQLAPVVQLWDVPEPTQALQLLQSEASDAQSKEPPARTQTSQLPVHAAAEPRFAGHAVAEPVQLSATSRFPEAGRHTVVGGDTTSDGREPKSHTSAGSHGPAELRHTVPLGAMPMMSQISYPISGSKIQPQFSHAVSFRLHVCRLHAALAEGAVATSPNRRAAHRNPTALRPPGPGRARDGGIDMQLAAGAAIRSMPAACWVGSIKRMRTSGDGRLEHYGPQ